jgi:signal peptidase I
VNDGTFDFRQGATSPHDDPGSAAYVKAWDRYAAKASPKRRQPGLIREAVQTLVVALLIFVGTQTVVQGREINGPSMEPNYHAGERLFLNKAVYFHVNLEKLSQIVPFLDSDNQYAYLFHGPRRGEVIVFHPPFPSHDDLIKRVIGTPGDHVVIRNGVVTVNGQRIAEPYLEHGVRTSCDTGWCDITLRPGQYYVMGDNRSNSSDSRLWGPVQAGSIVGKAWFISFPFSDFGWAP